MKQRTITITGPEWDAMREALKTQRKDCLEQAAHYKKHPKVAELYWLLWADTVSAELTLQAAFLNLRLHAPGM